MIPLAILLVRASIADASAFSGCYEPGLCDQRFYIIVANHAACDQRMSTEFLQRVENGWLYDHRNIGIFAACRDFRAGILYTLCRDPQTLHELPECATLPTVSGSHPRAHVNSNRTPRPSTPRRGVSVLSGS